MSEEFTIGGQLGSDAAVGSLTPVFAVGRVLTEIRIKYCYCAVTLSTVRAEANTSKLWSSTVKYHRSLNHKNRLEKMYACMFI